MIVKHRSAEFYFCLRCISRRRQGGKTVKTGKWINRLGAGLLALALLLSCGVPALADPEMPAVDLDLLLAENAAAMFRPKDADGNLLTPHKDLTLQGRGIPDTAGEEPDYRGIVGFMALQTDWEVSRFSTFANMPWLLPTYDRDGKGGWKQIGSIRHKQAVMVVDQEIQESKGKKYAGYLQVIRLDVNDKLWVDVKNFVTVPYWTLPLEEAVQYGYCVAVYREKSRELPMDKKRHHGPLPEGTRVLMCDRRTMLSRLLSPSPATNPLPGIIFRSSEQGKAHLRNFLFFNPEDLTLVY